MDKDLIDQYKKIHKKKEYGTTGRRLLGLLSKACNDVGAKTVLNYGCGQSELGDYFSSLDKYDQYDPAVEKYSSKPSGRYDLVLCIDVMEHIIEQDIQEVLQDIRSYSRNSFFTIAQYPASEILPDGRNAHVTIKDTGWWRSELLQHWDTVVSPYPAPLKNVYFLCST
jgi:hypothetical protein